MKRCSTCREFKPLEAFSKNSATKDGLQNCCILCRRALAKTPEEKETKKAYRRRPEVAQKTRSLNRRYLDSEAGRERMRVTSRRQRLREPDKCAARQAVSNAVRDGRLLPQPCEKCGAKAEAHHDDYSKPLDVRWLCMFHHKEHHASLRKVA